MKTSSPLSGIYVLLLSVVKFQLANVLLAICKSTVHKVSATLSHSLVVVFTCDRCGVDVEMRLCAAMYTIDAMPCTEYWNCK